MLDELAIYNLSVKYPNTIDLVREVERIAKAEVIDEVFKKLYDIRDSLPFKYSEHWTSRDSDAISTLFIEYEKQVKEQNNEKT